MQSPQVIRYTVDAEDKILDASQGFVDFAAGNGWGHGSWRGTSLWAHISGTGVISLYRTLMRDVRAVGEPVSFAFRCDSPELRRHCEMVMERGPGGRIVFTSNVLSEEAREPIDLLAAPRVVSPVVVTMCSFCHSLKVGDAWVPLEAGVASLEDAWGETDPMVSHGLCVPCRDRVLGEISSASVDPS